MLGRRITRYVVSELLKVFLLTLTAMTLVMILVGVAQEALRQGLGPSPLLRLIPYLLPNALRFAVPGTLLFAACSVFGRMSAANEIVAIKSMGISPTVVVAPALFLSFFISLAAVWLNDVAASWGRTGVRRVVLQSVEQIAYGMLRTQRSYSTKRFAINVMRVDDRTLVRPTLTFYATDDAPAFTLTAAEAELRFNPEADSLSLVLTDSEVDWGDNWTASFPGTTRHDIPLSLAARKGDGGSGPSDVALRQITRRIADQKQEIVDLQQTLAATAALQMLTGDLEGLAGSEWPQRHEQLKSAEILLFRLYTEPWRRWANGFSGFFFVMVGAPLAIRLRNADFWTSFGLCFLPILILYYPLLAYGVDRAKCGALPPYSVWLGNLLLLGLGLWVMRRVVRY